MCKILDRFLPLEEEKRARSVLPAEASGARLDLIQTLDDKPIKLYFAIDQTTYRVVLSPLSYEGYELHKYPKIERYTADGEHLMDYWWGKSTMEKRIKGRVECLYYYQWRHSPPKKVAVLAGSCFKHVLGWAYKRGKLYIYYQVPIGEAQ